MKARHFLIPFAVVGFLNPFGQAALPDHIPQYLIDELFYEFEEAWCQEYPEYASGCHDYAGDSEYVYCVKNELNNYYSREQVEAILRFKNQYGYISEADLAEYEDSVWLAEIFC